MIAHSHDDLLFFCLLSAAFLAFPKKPPRVSPLRVACGGGRWPLADCGPLAAGRLRAAGRWPTAGRWPLADCGPLAAGRLRVGGGAAGRLRAAGRWPTAGRRWGRWPTAGRWSAAGAAGLTGCWGCARLRAA